MAEKIIPRFLIKSADNFLGGRMKKSVLITGASGNMGEEVLKQIIETNKFAVRILLREKKSNIKLAKRLKKKYPDTLCIYFGDISNYEDCKQAVTGIDYLIHCAAIIPPTSDHNPELTYNSNFIGTKNLVNAVKEADRLSDKTELQDISDKNNPPSRIKFIHIGTVAEYGNRTFKHPWIRTGDPLISSPFDYYGATKIMGERCVIESGLTWVSLRQSGVLYDRVMLNNMNDGLMFHTGWNTPIEWATAGTSGLMLKNLLLKDCSENLPSEFWRKVYNIGNGENARVTGYDTINRGFVLMGRTAKEIFKPHWNAARNFHCGWFFDSKILNEYLDFQYEGFEEFFSKLEKKFWYFKLGKPFPYFIRKFALEPLLKNSNAPMYWVKNNFEPRVKAFFGSKEKFEAIPKKWEEYNLLCENKNPNTGEYIDYNKLKNEANAKNFLLSHGYDESKPDNELDIKDMQDAAEFRGGECLSSEMQKGDLYTPLKWKCACNHSFEASPYLILKAGHWCPDCACPPWNFDEQARHSKFYAQLWYDDHSPEENNFYDKNCFYDIN